jgi:hypothetical protein
MLVGACPRRAKSKLFPALFVDEIRLDFGPIKEIILVDQWDEDFAGIFRTPLFITFVSPA